MSKKSTSQYSGMKKIIRYECKFCGLEVKTKKEALKHSRLPNPDSVALDLPTNLVLVEKHTGNKLYHLIEEAITTTYHKRICRCHAFTFPISGVFYSISRSSLAIKRDLQNGDYKILTPEEFEKFKKDFAETIYGKDVDKLVRTTPELEALVAEG